MLLGLVGWQLLRHLLGHIAVHCTYLERLGQARGKVCQLRK